VKNFVFTLTLASFATILQAQSWFVGSSFGYKRNVQELRGSNWNTKETFTKTSIVPTFGYQMSRFAVGGSIGFMYESTVRESTWVGGQNRRVRNTFLWGIQPFVRYTFAEFGRFSVFAKAEIHILSGNTSVSFDRQPAENEYSLNSLGINIVPVLSYNLFRNINLEVALNFMSLGWKRTRTVSDQRPNEEIINRYFGLNSANLIDVSAISVGFIYKFAESDRSPRGRDTRTPRPGRIITVPGL